MSVQGSQDFWVVGARFYFQRDVDGATTYPAVDLGVIQSVTPQIESERLELEDSDGGIKRVVDSGAASFTESYDITLSNLSLYNLSVMLLGKPPSSFTQAAAEKTVTHEIHPGALCKLHDSDGDSTWLYALASAGCVYTGAVATKNVYGTGTAVDAAAKKIIIAGDQTAVAGLAPGKAFFLNRAGLTNILNSRTYTIVTRTLVSGQTELVVSESIAANETTLVGATITHENGGTILKQDVDWEVVSLDRGFIRAKTGGAIVAVGSYSVIFSLGALSGTRIMFPQTAGELKGKSALVLSRGGNKDVDVRECRVTLVPTGASWSADDYSTFTLRASVLSDATRLSDPAGRMLHVKGNVPDVS